MQIKSAKFAKSSTKSGEFSLRKLAVAKQPVTNKLDEFLCFLQRKNASLSASKQKLAVAKQPVIFDRRIHTL